VLRQTFLILTGLLLIPQVAYAERWFEVEIYLFERSSGHIQEQAPEHVILPQTQNAVDLISAIINPNANSDLIRSNCTGANVSADISATDTDMSGTNINSTNMSAESESSTAPCIEQATSTSTGTGGVTRLTQIPVNIAAATPQHGQVGGSAVLLSQSQGQFDDIISKLSSNGYQSLLHMTWQQAMLPRHRAIPIRLFAGHDFSAAYEPDGNPIQAATTHVPAAISEKSARYNHDDNLISMPLLASNSMDNHLDLFAANSAPVVPQAVWELDGTIKIYLNHYLYVETALNLREEGTKNVPMLQDISRIESDPEIIATPFLFAYPMTQNRRIRSGEIHYFDHPSMGMVLQIRKIVNTAENGEIATQISSN